METWTTAPTLVIDPRGTPALSPRPIELTEVVIECFEFVSDKLLGLPLPGPVNRVLDLPDQIKFKLEYIVVISLDMVSFVIAFSPSFHGNNDNR
ncbi:hypothetical protein J6590_032880 [Homalodisca vitripennis]|nr:hypothetical protein J6590_032880 [Homalodisca vitripennis]